MCHFLQPFNPPLHLRYQSNEYNFKGHVSLPYPPIFTQASTISVLQNKAIKSQNRDTLLRFRHQSGHFSVSQGIRTEPGLGRKHFRWASHGGGGLPPLPHSLGPETDSDTHTHIQLPHFIGTKEEGGRPTPLAHPPGVSRLQHLVQHEYIINTGNVGWVEWGKIPYTGRRLEALPVLGTEAYTVLAQST